MAQLIYSAICSLDQYVVDASGSFRWAAPDDQVHAFVNEQEGALGAHLLGRRMYDVLKVWDTFGSEPGPPSVGREYHAVWMASDKVVYSSTLEEVETKRTRLEREFDPTAVRAMVDDASQDMSIGGPTLAAAALRAGIVDRIDLYLNPIVVGGGTPALPDDVHLDLELLHTERFDGGVVYVRYAVQRSG